MVVHPEPYGDDHSLILDALKHASGFIRTQLAQRIQLRSFPQLRFIWDPSPAHAERIEELINEIHKQDKQDKQDQPESEDDDATSDAA